MLGDTIHSTVVAVERESETPLRRRGGRVVDKLRSTDDFSCKDLELPQRKLILFLVVTLVDKFGQLTTTYDSLIDRFGNVEGHWAAGKNRGQLQKACARYLGKAATPGRLQWERIRDLLVAAGREEALPEAAYLFCQATGRDQPEERYRGEIRRPHWDQPGVTPITSTMIGGLEWAARFWSAATTTSPAPPPAVPGLSGERDDEVFQLVQSLTRAWREAMAMNGRLRQEVDLVEKLLARAQGEKWGLLRYKSKAEKTTARLRRENMVFRGEIERMLRSLHPNVGEETVRNLMADMPRAADFPDPRNTPPPAGSAEATKKRHLWYELRDGGADRTAWWMP
ncbi:hypothetical protein LX83_003444 [Goodfellowiella coeruleoviolacea]|uniref:Uncharacterized protein n=1 Tax=Goodfellowiella coeruleoviolacea TaxID=334858 RepID=A0AAE3GE65_9PSEU|nr:hypothetical protein [Goodfellowiella coeruleoviolacea]